MELDILLINRHQCMPSFYVLALCRVVVAANLTDEVFQPVMDKRAPCDKDFVYRLIAFNEKGRSPPSEVMAIACDMKQH